ncbi:MAG: hypothetical protein JXA54_15840 [Candidatus Heimdallarchaeota archaeon]|nr:hypothetical protein [Candidatus Heimdallarchaeota archaeon]
MHQKKLITIMLFLILFASLLVNFVPVINLEAKNTITFIKLAEFATNVELLMFNCKMTLLL